MPAVPDYVRRLPIGQQLPVDEVLDDELFPFQGELTVKPLEEPRIPEPQRRGVEAADCWSCRPEAADVAWEDARWRVVVDREPHGLPMVAILLPKAHHDLEDLPMALATELGPMIQRVALAIGTLNDVGRVHVNRWGDGSFHFHVWFLARPLGMWQMRGAMLAVWDDLLPKVPAEEWDTNRRAVAAALAAG